MTLNDIIANAIRSAGGDGLVNADIECGCGLGDLMPCECPNFDMCEIAVNKPKDGEDWFVPLRKESEE